MLSSARDLKVKAMSCLSKEERLASQLAKEQAKIQRANQRMKDLASRVEEVKEGGRRADNRAELMEENQELRGKLAMKSRAVDELENFQVQGQQFLQSEGYQAYLEFDAVRGSEQWNHFLQWQQQQDQQQNHLHQSSLQS